MPYTWKDLENLGWQRKEINLGGKMKIIFKAPPENGVMRTVSRERDLKKNEKCFSHILFPKSRMSLENRMNIEFPNV